MGDAGVANGSDTAGGSAPATGSGSVGQPATQRAHAGLERGTLPVRDETRYTYAPESTVDSGSLPAAPQACPSSPDGVLASPSDAAAARPWPRTFLGALEHGLYRLLRVPVFILLEAFRRYAGR